MKDKNNVVVAIGLLVIVGIVAWITYGNYEISTLAKESDDSTNAILLQQKDMAIKKLVNRLKVVQKQLDEVRTEMSSISQTGVTQQ